MKSSFVLARFVNVNVIFSMIAIWVGEQEAAEMHALSV